MTMVQPTPVPQQWAQPGPSAPPYPAARQPRRPGLATATGVVGIIIGVLAFGTAATLLLIAGSGVDSQGPSYGGLLSMLWLCGSVGTVAAVLMFVGAIQVLSGRSVRAIITGAVLGLASIWTLCIWAANVLAGGEATILMVGLVYSVAPAIILAFSLNGEVRSWVAARKSGLPPA